MVVPAPDRIIGLLFASITSKITPPDFMLFCISTSIMLYPGIKETFGIRTIRVSVVAVDRFSTLPFHMILFRSCVSASIVTAYDTLQALIDAL